MVRRVKSFGKLFFWATLVALSVRLFLLEDYRISSRSMAPTLLPGDLVFISKMAFNIRLPFSTYEVFKFARPVAGDIVAFSVPDRGIETFVKRVIAGEGDRVQIKEGQLIVNGNFARNETNALGEVTEILPNGLHHAVALGQEPMQDFGPIDVPKNHFFVLGDNRNESVDSRAWGPVPYSCLKGRLGVVWMSLAENGSVRGSRIGLQVN